MTVKRLPSPGLLFTATVPPCSLVSTIPVTSWVTATTSTVNTLVFAPGGNRFGDYAKVGLPLLLLMLLVSIFLPPMIWQLY